MSAPSPASAAERDLSLDDCSRPGRPSIICCFIIADALNTATRRGEIDTSAPVFGFRPIHLPFWRTMNVPNDDSLTVSPLAMLSEISFSTSSTRVETPNARGGGISSPAEGDRARVAKLDAVECLNPNAAVMKAEALSPQGLCGVVDHLFQRLLVRNSRPAAAYPLPEPL